MVRTLALTALLSMVVVPAVAEDLAVLSEGTDGPAPKEMMHAYLMRAAGAALDRRDAEYEKLKTPDQLAAYQRQIRRFFVDALGGFPERTPLEPQVVAKENRDGYRIEKVIFQSQPRLFVTAVLYLPDAKPPYPGVLVPCGHSNNGKAAEPYQRVSILLALNGMAALCYDPIDQGERFQLLDDGKPQIGGTTAHSALGIGSTLLGRNTATYRIWDGMRAIDYLQSRKEVDPERIGCTGNSGGGTLTSYLMALDPRIGCAAPSCYLTSLRRLIETIGPQDAEQNIHAQIGHGMDHADYVLVRAPKPTLMCVATRDYFDIDGAWSTFRQAKRFYTRLGLPERISLIESDAGHGFNTQLRTGAVRWMRRWLLKVDDAITEPDFPIAGDEDMLCTPGGQVMLLAGARSTYDLNVALEEKLAAGRKEFWRRTDKAGALAEVRRVSGIRKLADLPVPKCHTIGTIERDNHTIGHTVEKLVLQPEPGIRLPALAFVPEKPSGDACLYLHGNGKQAAAQPGGPIDKLLAEGCLVLAVDLRGLGETAGAEPGTRSISRHVGGDWKDLYLAYLLGKSYLAMRAEDVLVAARFLAGYRAGRRPNRIRLISTGRTGPAALHAAALEPRLFASVELHGCLESWAGVVRTPLGVAQFENVVHGALKTYDLPDLLNTLPKKQVTWADPVDALGQPLGK